MRGVRSFIVLLIVAIGLGWYAWRESKKPASEDKKPQEKVFAGLQSEKIDQVTIKSDKGETTTVRKQGDKWEETQPAAAPADEAELSGITSNLSSLEIQRVVDDQPADLRQYGLQPARIEVAFKTGNRQQGLLLGQKTPTGTDLYAKVPDQPRVFLVSSYLETTFDKSPFDLRDKTVLKIDRDKIDHVEIDGADRKIAFAKDGADWKITSPLNTRADFGAIEGLLGKINSAQMKAITAANPSDLKEYGLEKPDYTVRLGAGSSQAGLAIGKSAGTGAVYAKDLSRPMVFTIDSSLADDLKKPADEYRVKDLFDARSFNTTHVEITRGGVTTAFDKQKDAWKQVAPAQKAADGAKVDALVSAVTNTRASSFVDSTKDTGLDAPELTVALKYDDGHKEERVSFGKHGSDAFARREGDPGAAKIDASSLDAIVKAADALK